MSCASLQPETDSPTTNRNAGTAAPLFRWVGGKRRLLAQIRHHVPQVFGTYYEPFLGGAALFFCLKPSRSVLGDLNSDLVRFYCAVRDNPRALISELESYAKNKEEYLRVRKSKPTGDIKRAARFYYLVCLAFNGIYRVNKEGEFNVPYGRNPYRKIVDEKKLMAAHLALANSVILESDFEETVASATAGDLVYFDPPYTVAHDNNGFLQYNESIFSWADQERLVRVATKLQKRGVTVLVSNANHDSLRELYAQTETHLLRRASTIAASGRKRGEVREIFAIFHPK